MQVTYPQTEKSHQLSPDGFRRGVVGRKPIIITGVIDRWPAITRWTPAYFRAIAGDMTVKVKRGDVAEGRTELLPLGKYMEMLATYDAAWRSGTAAPDSRPPYLHDTPMIATLPVLRDDLSPFPVGFFPRWYRKQWWRFTQFFYGPPGSVTPLHFDTLETHNLFFQVSGKKRFIIVPPRSRHCCYPHRWRWSPIDVENPDFDRYPRFRDAAPVECTLGPGDVLYIPPGSFHQVRSLDTSISLNIDWHTRRSAVKGVFAILRGMPPKNVYYNAIHAAGLCARIPSPWLFPLYRSYLDYIS